MKKTYIQPITGTLFMEDIMVSRASNYSISGGTNDENSGGVVSDDGDVDEVDFAKQSLSWEEYDIDY